jgi:hypothetical protein
MDAKRENKDYIRLQENLYLLHWRQNVVREIPDAYIYTEDLVNGCSALRSAIIALSACDLAKMHAEVQSFSMEHSVRWDYGMNKDHQMDANCWYNKAKCDLGSMEYDKQHKVAVLATLLLFVHIEAHIGTFRGTAFHHHGIEHLLSSDDTISKSRIGNRLISTWVSSRSQNWSCRIPFTLLNFEETLRRLRVDVDLALDPINARDETVTIIILQSWYLSLMLLFERYAGRGDIESIASKCVRDIYQRISGNQILKIWQPYDQISDENYTALLHQQRKNLKKWHASLPASQLPIECTNTESETFQPSQLEMPPISSSRFKFYNQRAAINYAYYIVARILQSSEILNEYLTMVDFDNTAEKISLEANHLLSELQQVIASIEVSRCIRYCTYTIGLFQLIRMCQLRLPRHSATICRLAESLVSTLAANCISNDGHVHVSRFTYEHKITEDQRARGRDLFYIMPLVSPDTAVQTNPSDCAISSAVVYGRDRASKKLYCEILSSGSD